MRTVHARVTILVASAVLSLTTLAGPAMAAPLPDGPGTPAPAAPSVPQHVDARTKSTQPVYDYANAIRESVYVDTTMDTDSDGKDDVIAVDIVRPSEPVLNGTKIPVIMDASPYYSCCGRGNESEKKTYDGDGVIRKMPLFYDNYFVPRGYAMVGVDVVGTGRSTGCGDVGGRDEIQSVVDVIDWLNGRNTAHTANGQPVKASWTTGAVGMIGKSYDGTLANGVAATGVRGLKTIVPISAISSWYDYTRSGGVPYSDDYMPWLGGYVGHDSAACDEVRGKLGDNDDDDTGNYTSFWAERDYTKNVSKVKASVFMTHGLSDYNVQTNHFSQWWSALSRNDVPRKLWLGLEDHVDPFEFRRDEWVDELHKWFDYWLQGLQNGVMNEPMVSVETAPDVWRNYKTWPAVNRPVSVPLAAGKLGAAGKGSVMVTDDPELTEDDIVADPSEVIAGRQMFLSAPLTAPLRISGTPSVTLRLKSDSSTTPVTARLVEYGEAARYAGIRRTDESTCEGSSTDYDDSCYFTVDKVSTQSDHGIVSRGWIDAAHSKSLSQPTPLKPGQWTTVTVPLRAQDQIIPKGRIVGLAITLSDTEWTTPNTTGATIDIDLAASKLNVPVASGHLTAPTQIPTINVQIKTPTQRPNLHDPKN
ncbi:Xaa-Pro dipeptidyl-peptidase [Kribbella sp. VKM Ac-2566]|uniref:Xaa-Pro dipeptidyl-peptidase n=1 Tax=Kribbella sp. VKM Ac-2566 TaxID=2512218 RepID=UPI001063ADA8|nr:Xaa-Pro dipeptidyl-peptidase [Kribbella sp. VKM Ac-2566]TDW97768.1 X-Pro dipeptidyl-peptidase [Kribbella sp. VKM Ac-2566]